MHYKPIYRPNEPIIKYKSIPMVHHDGTPGSVPGEFGWGGLAGPAWTIDPRRGDDGSDGRGSMNWDSSMARNYDSLDWLKGKSTGNHGVYHQIWPFPLITKASVS